MSVYKEGFSAVDLISNAADMIFPDSCDWGTPTKKGASKDGYLTIYPSHKYKAEELTKNK